MSDSSKMRIAYLGPKGSYSGEAAGKVSATKFDAIPYANFGEVFGAAESGHCVYCIVPIENSVEGGVNQNLDLLTKTPLSVMSELNLFIDNRLFFKKGHGEIVRVLSHPQAYAQCQATVSKLLPNAVFLPTDSTSAALAGLDAHTAGIAGLHNQSGIAPDYEMSGCSVNDCENNVTRFFVLAMADAQRLECFGSPDKVSVVFEARNEPGGLTKILNIFSDYGLNMTGILSRPHKTVLGRYLFFVDMTPDSSGGSMKSAIDAATRIAPYFKVLGYYGQMAN